MLTSNIALNVSPGEVPPVVRVSQYDAGSRKLAFHLIAQDGELILPPGLQAEIRGTKPDGNGFSYLCTIQENIVTANLTAQMTAVAGNVICEVILFVGTPATSDEPASADFQQLGTANFILAVEKAALDKDTLLSGSEIRQLVLIMDHKDAIIDAANRSEAATIHMGELIEEHDAAMAHNAAESAAALEQITQDAKDYIDQKTDEIETDLSALKDAAEAAADAAKDSEDAAAAALVTVEEKKVQILNITTNANQTASQALTIANQALDESGATSAQLDETLSKINEVLLSTESMVDGGYEEDGYLYLTAKDTVVVGPLGPFAGGGGGGGGGSSTTYVITLTNLLPSRTLNLAEGGEAVLRFSYTSVDGEGYDDGQGIGTIYKIKRLELPSTVTNLTIRDAAEFEMLDMAGYRNLTTLRIENTPNVPVADILSAASSLNRVRLIGLDWEVDTAADFESIVQKLTTTGGLDASGGNTDRAVVSGIVRVSDTVTPDLLSTCADYFPDLVVFSDGVANCTVKFRNADGTLLYTGTVPYGSNAPDPVANHTIVTPT